MVYGDEVTASGVVSDRKSGEHAQQGAAELALVGARHGDAAEGVNHRRLAMSVNAAGAGHLGSYSPVLNRMQK